LAINITPNAILHPSAVLYRVTVKFQVALFFGFQQLKHISDVEVNLHPFQTSAPDEHARASLSLGLDMVEERRISEIAGI
jgi:hypothetical protein